MTARIPAVERVADGTKTITGQFRTWVAAPGLRGAERARAVLGRAAGTFACAWFVGGILYALGLLWWGACALWLLSTLVVGKGDRRPMPVAPAAKGRPGNRERGHLLTALDQITRGTTGVHLWPTVYEGLREFPRYAELEETELRALLRENDVPVRKLTAGGVRGRNGIHRVSIEALLPEAAPAPPPLPSAPLAEEERRADLRKSSPSAPSTEAPEGVGCGIHELGDDTLAMLQGEVSSR